jgi:hypothetical protein
MSHRIAILFVNKLISLELTAHVLIISSTHGHREQSKSYLTSLIPHCHSEEPKSYPHSWMAHGHSVQPRSHLTSLIQHFPSNFTFWTFNWHLKKINMPIEVSVVKVHTSLTYSVTEMFYAPYTCHIELPLNQSVTPNVVH